MLGEKITTVEKDLQQDVENMTNVVEVLDCLQKASKTILDLIMAHDDQIEGLLDKVKTINCILRVWNIILTILLTIIASNVFL